jgi:ribosomal protein S18 acetylase RimI-like enzyme
MLLRIVEPTSTSHIEGVRGLWVEYWNWLEFAPCFQDFENELKTLPGRYAAPDGCILIALYDGELAGCVALRRLDNNGCEMKRLYVRPAFRGKGIGIALATAIVEEARERHYAFMRLDTLPSMEKAISIYRSLSFEEIEPYVDDPVAGAKYLELKLQTLES